MLESIKKPHKDLYLWLEEIEGEDALAWVRDRNSAFLKQLQSGSDYQTLQDTIEKELTASDRIPFGSFDGDYVYNFWQDELHVRGILRRTSLASYKTETPDWETVLDVDALAKAEGENWVYGGADFLEPTRDRALVTLSQGGQDASFVREFDLVAKTFIEDGFFVKEAKSSIAWCGRDQLVICSDFGPGSLTKSGYARIAKLWNRGTAIEDAQTLFEGEKSDTGIAAADYADGDGRAVMVVQSKTFFTRQYYLLQTSGELCALPLPPTASIEASVFHGQLIVALKEEWNVAGTDFPQGAIVCFDLNKFTANGEIFVELLRGPTKTETIEAVAAAKDYLFVLVLSDVKNRLLRYQQIGGAWTSTLVPLPDDGSLSLHSVSSKHNQIMVSYENFLTPTSLYIVDGPNAPLGPIKQAPERFDASEFISEQCFASSPDGTRIPYFIVKPKSMNADGQTPTLQYGYGGFEISLKPAYLGPVMRQWLARGGAYVIANIRGGGEYGPAWHRSALKQNRQRAYDDFIAVSEDLIANSVTSPGRLGIMGGSNGGLLMGAMLTQRPELYGAIVCAVPLLDMERFHLLLAGASWIDEFGDPDDADEGAYLSSYSPYHQLRADQQYPRVFFMTSTKDDRVHPGHARKMAARMEEYGHKFFYYENIEGGHGGAANLSQQARNGALQISYLTRQLMTASDPDKV